jgi:hypothetical protein
MSEWNANEDTQGNVEPAWPSSSQFSISDLLAMATLVAMLLAILVPVLLN